MIFQLRTRYIAVVMALLVISMTACQLKIPPPPWAASAAAEAKFAPAHATDERVIGPKPLIVPQVPRAVSSPVPGNQTIRELGMSAVVNPRPGQTKVPLSYYLTQSDKTYPEPPSLWATSQNFLILGTDKRPNDPIWRTDVIMIVGLDQSTGQAAMLSVPRDLFVEIPGTSPNRINTVDYLGEHILRIEGGGALLVSQVLHKTLGIKTEHWVRIQMDGLPALVDALGGVTVELECPFFEPILNLDTNEWEYFTLPAGKVTLTGDDARWFVRLRLRESDIGRSHRQRQLLNAIKDQMLSTNAFILFPTLWSAMSEIYDTDLDLATTMQLATLALSLDRSKIHSGGVTSEDGALINFRTKQGAQVLQIGDEEAVRRMVEGIWFTESSMENQPQQKGCLPIPTEPPGNPYSSPAVQGTLLPTATVEISN